MAGKDFVFPRKNGTFAFRRRYPADLAKQFPKPIRWILLDTHSATEAKELAREKAVAFDKDMARLRIEAGLAKGLRPLLLWPTSYPDGPEAGK